MSNNISLYIQSPLYGGLARAEYMESVMRLQSYCIRNNIGFRWHAVTGESLVQRARNEITHSFLKSGFTHMLSIDGDIEFQVEDVKKLLAANKDIIGATYPLKRLPLEYVVNHIPGVTSNKEISEVACIGTGLMLVKRKVFNELKKAYPENDYIGDQKPFIGEPLHAYYDTGVRDGRYLSEDYTFCSNYRKIGGKVWIDPSIRLGHIGFHKYG